MEQRACGILLHPTSLPGRFGIGDIGPQAFGFVDFLYRSSQRYWQILPLGHISYGNSPYMCFSAFGGNPYLISPELLLEDGLLTQHHLESTPLFSAERVDYGRAMSWKMHLLRKSFELFKRRYNTKLPDDYYVFCESNAFWLEDYALFSALKDAHKGDEWMEWERGASERDPDALISWRNHLASEIQLWKYIQYQFFRQWTMLKHHCHRKNIRIIGDVPVYVAQDSAEVWAHRDLFHLDKKGYPPVVSGVPPDYFSKNGQRWGNPIYRWNIMAENGYRWWIDRFRMNFAMADVLRLDHFRGFEAYWEVPADEPTAVNGHWAEGPGMRFFNAIKSALGNVDMIAEDLGVITPEVDKLRDELGYPGMKILQMAFGKDPKASEYRPHNHIRNCVVYTATHDHNTTAGWFNAEPGSQSTQSRDAIERERNYALSYTDSDGNDIAWDFIRLALGSVANLALYPLQDVFSLGTNSRMNLPGTIEGNWEWRFPADSLTDEVSTRLKALAEIYERIPPERDIVKDQPVSKSEEVIIGEEIYGTRPS